MTTEPNTAEEINTRKESARIAWEAREADGEKMDDVSKIKKEIEKLLQEHTAQTLDRLKESVEGLKYDEEMQEWAYDYGTYNKALDDVLNLIEEVSDE